MSDPTFPGRFDPQANQAGDDPEIEQAPFVHTHVLADGTVLTADTAADLLAQVEDQFVFPTHTAE